VDAGQARASALRQPDALLGRVVENKVLTKGGPVKRHIGECAMYPDWVFVYVLPEFALPEGITSRGILLFCSLALFIALISVISGRLCGYVSLSAIARGFH
jgi:hypothetical protein